MPQIFGSQPESVSTCNPVCVDTFTATQVKDPNDGTSNFMVSSADGTQVIMASPEIPGEYKVEVNFVPTNGDGISFAALEVTVIDACEMTAPSIPEIIYTVVTDDPITLTYPFTFLHDP